MMDPSRIVVLGFYSTRVPAQAPVRMLRPLGTRVVAMSPGFDPIEIALDKKTKKKLIEAMDRTTGEMDQFLELHEDTMIPYEGAESGDLCQLGNSTWYAWFTTID